MCLDKQNGGLDVKGLLKLNKVSLGKWNWRFANERNSLRRKTFNSKFGECKGVGAQVRTEVI